jgi:NAD(P)H-dependent FMN reductase
MKLFEMVTAALSALVSPMYAPTIDTLPQVMVVVCTDRQESLTRSVAENFLLAYNRQDMFVDACNIADLDACLYSPASYHQRPDDFQKFNKKWREADLIVLVTPEYNATIPAPLTRVINMLSFPDSFKDKKFVIISVSVSPYGAARAHDQLKKILTDLHGIVLESACLKMAHADQVTKSAEIYTQHAEDIVAALA